MRKIGAGAVLTLACFTVMVANAPSALASTPVAGPVTEVVVQPVDWESGYQQGLKDGYRDGKAACGAPGVNGGRGSTDEGYVAGYNQGFADAQYECNGDG